MTSSPRYPRSNGKAENTVKTAKLITKKALEAKCDVYLALLDFCNTHSEYLHSSPAQRMFGRRAQTLLPLSPSLLEPEPARQTTALKAAMQSKGQAGTAVQPGNGVHEASQWDVRTQCRPMDSCASYQVHGPSLLPGRVKVQRFAGISASCALHRSSTRPHLSRRSSTTKSKEAHNLRHRLVTQLTIRSYVSHARHKLQYSIFLPQSIMLQTKPYQSKQQ